MASQSHSDVLIIGGGPAGCATAISAARAGLSVALLSRPERPGRIRPGEALHPGLEPLLDQLGVGQALREADFLRFPGHRVAWEGAPQFVPFGRDSDGPWRGFQAWRARFDALLLAGAAECGVTIIPDQAARRLKPGTDGRPEAVTTGKQCLSAKVLVDATGSRRWLSRRLGLAQRHHSPRLVAWYAYACRLPEDLPELPIFRADAQGWTWTAAVAPRLLQWVRLRFAAPRLDSDSLNQLLCRGDLLRPAAGADVSWSETVPPAGPGYYLVGDAACQLDPASSHGVLRAVMSGMMVGLALRRQLLEGLPEATANASYSRWLQRWYRHDVLQLRGFYGRHPNPPDWCQRDIYASASA